MNGSGCGTDGAACCGAAAGGANTGAPAIAGTTCPLDGGDATYNLTIQAATASTYTLNAAPVGDQANDGCGTLVITNTGAKSVSGAASFSGSINRQPLDPMLVLGLRLGQTAQDVEPIRWSIRREDGGASGA